jgi:DNA-binding response OmpR family regulator
MRFETSEVETGGGAQKMDEGRPDGLLDLGLPAGLAELCSTDYEARDGYPAWLIVSALDEDEARRRYGPLKGTFVPKPFDPWNLVKKLEDLLEQRPARNHEGERDLSS